MQKRYKDVVLICSTISHCCSYQAWYSKIKLTLDEHGFFDALARGAVEGASLIASLIMLRKMDNFLSGRKFKKDDVVCTDFNLSVQDLLTEGERKDINKRVAHMTIATEMDAEFDRNLYAMYQRVFPILESVLDELLDKYGKDGEYTKFEIQQTIQFLQEMNAGMEAAVQQAADD